MERAFITLLGSAAPAALDRLASDNPQRYAKVAAVLEAAAKPPCESEATRLLKVVPDR
jgi:hypothetical protein